MGIDEGSLSNDSDVGAGHGKDNSKHLVLLHQGISRFLSFGPRKQEDQKKEESQ